jgi:hypothetical protein
VSNELCNEIQITAVFTDMLYKRNHIWNLDMERMMKSDLARCDLSEI